MKKIYLFFAVLAFFCFSANAQNDPTNDDWSTSGSNTTTLSNVGIGTAVASAYLLHVNKMAIEPHITVENLGMNGGATFRMIDFNSGADFKFKSTQLGDFKIRDQTNTLDVIYILGDGTGFTGIGTNTPGTQLEVAGVITATGGSSSDWNTAFGWGDHSVPGYLTSESDPQVGAISTSYIPRWNGTALVTGTVQDDGSTIGIGTAPVSTKNLIISNFGWQSQLRVERGSAWIDINPNTGTAASVIQSSKHLALAADDDLTKVLSLKAGKAGVGVDFGHTPISTMEVQGNLAVGANYIGTAAPANGAIIEGNVGVGTSSPVYDLEVLANTSRGLDIDQTYTTGTAYGAYHENLTAGTNTKYGYRNYMTGATGGTHYGISSSIYSGSTATGTKYGLYSFISSTAGTGTHYAVYASAGLADNQWAGYFSGNTYFTQDVRMGYTADVPGYKLAVNGKVICEELKVQDSGSWPDYVFDKDYNLLPLDQVANYIKANNHLPGVPSAECVEQDGISIGEMSKVLMEKIEELTLHTIEQQNLIENQQKTVENQQKTIENLSKKVDNLMR